MKISYPNPSIMNKISKTISQTNSKHGMIFENALNSSNEYYLMHNIACIYKKPTPIQVVKVDYPSRNKARIVEAYYKTPSTTDYNGIYKGKYIDYEAKETNNLSFPFKHIFDHQIKHLQKVDQMGGIAFVIIYYRKINEVYIIDIKEFLKLYYDGYNGISKKSISVEMANKYGINVSLGYTPLIDYLDAVNKLYKL